MSLRSSSSAVAATTWALTTLLAIVQPMARSQTGKAATPKAAAAPTAAGAAQAPATPPKPSLTATVGDSGIVHLTFTDVNAGASTYEIVRSPKTGTTPPTVVFQLPKGQFFLNDETTSQSAGTTFVYTLFPVNAMGQRASASIDSTEAPIQNPIPATRKGSATYDFANRSQWQKIKGNWLPEANHAYSQADDSQVGSPLIFDEKSLWVGSGMADNGKMQVTAAINLSGWDGLSNLGNVFTTPPSYRFGIGFANTDPKRSGIFLVIKGDLTTPSCVIEEDDGKERKVIDISGLGWKPGTTIRMKLRVQRASNTAAKATITGKVWLDGQPEPSEVNFTDPVDWAWPMGTTVVPALFGGVQALGKQTVKVTFTDVALETFGPPPTTTSTTPPGTGVVTASGPDPLHEPGMDDPVQVPTVALKPLTIGQWGTLLSYVAPEEPLQIPCLPTPCPWKIPTVSGSCCRPDGSSPAPAVTIDPASPMVLPVDDPAILGPGLAPPLYPPSVMPHHALDPDAQARTAAMALGTVVRAGYLRFAGQAQDESVPSPAPRTSTQPPSNPTPSPPIPNTPEPIMPLQSTEPAATEPTTIAPTTIAPTTIAPTTIAPTTIAPTITQPPGTQPPTIAPTTIPLLVPSAAPAVADPVWSAGPGHTVPPARGLRVEGTTRRELRYFGAVATVPWPQADVQGSGSSGTLASRASRTDLVPHDPFSYQPRVDIIPLPTPRSATSSASSNPSSTDVAPDVDEIVDAPSGRVWTYHFDQPARFPKTQSGTACCAFEGEGAIIHEGMRVLARKDGQYEVRFNITAPPMPISLRMQLVLHEEGNALPARTLTLPPILLKPWGMDQFPDATQPKIDPVSYLVRVRGYSQVVKEVQQGNGHFLLVKRIGAARFGSGFQAQQNQ